MSNKPHKVCAGTGCKKWLKGKQRRFCSDTCNKRTWAQEKAAGKENITKAINKELKSDTGDYASVRRGCLLYTSPSPRDATLSRMPSSA